MSLNNFVFELENLEMKAKILMCTFSMCFDELSALAGEEGGSVILGLFNYACDLSDEMNKLVDKGFETIQKQKC